VKFTGAEISHRLIAGENKEQLEVTENKILDVTGQHMSAWEAESKSPEQLRGNTTGKLFQNILYNGNANGYPMLSNGNYPTSVYPDNIYPDLESASSMILWFPMNQLDSEPQNEFKD
jgi:hypothetical protein